MSLKPAFLDDLRARTTLSAVIQKQVKLTRVGREWKACCPFHNEKTPSFTVNDEKGFYHCFGCGAHGDAIRFLTDARGLSFMDAVRELADAAGMTLPAPDLKARERQDRLGLLREAMEAAARWFVEQLGGIEGEEPRSYLDRRGIDEETRRAFGLGYAPDSHGRIGRALKTFDKPTLIEAGLLVQPDDGEREPYDRFRGRLMIPIRDARGRMIAFGGRTLGPAEPKYLNSPDTPLFDKGRTLYNLDRAGRASREAGRVIVVEGYTDVFALARAGFAEAVAPLGTALTEGQLELLWRLSDAPILCFDGDAAGQRAAMRAAARALPMLGNRRTLRFLTLPPGKDPDDFIRSAGPRAFASLLDQPEALVDRIWRHEMDAEPLDTPEARAGLRTRLIEHSQSIADRAVREQYAAEYRSRFDARFGWKPRPQGGSRSFVQARRDDRPASASARAVGAGGVQLSLARAILAGLIRYPERIAEHSEALLALPLDNLALQRLREALIDAAFSGEPLEAARLGPILAAAGVAEIAEEITHGGGLAFSFTRGDGDPERARRDLAVAIGALASRPELDAALAAATARLQEAFDDAAFAEQQRLAAARRQADEVLAELLQRDDMNMNLVEGKRHGED